MQPRSTLKQCFYSVSFSHVESDPENALLPDLAHSTHSNVYSYDLAYHGSEKRIKDPFGAGCCVNWQAGQSEGSSKVLSQDRQSLAVSLHANPYSPKLGTIRD